MDSKRELHANTALLSAQEIIESVPDSLLYKTANGRTVIGGGGIIPDFITDIDSASVFLREVLSRNLANTYARTWFDREGEALVARWGNDRHGFFDSFAVEDAEFQKFLEYARVRGVLIGDEEGAFSESEIEVDRPYLEARIKARLAVRIFDLEAFYPVMHPQDKTLQAARKLWPEAEALVNN